MKHAKHSHSFKWNRWAEFMEFYVADRSRAVTLQIWTWLGYRRGPKGELEPELEQTQCRSSSEPDAFKKRKPTLQLTNLQLSNLHAQHVVFAAKKDLAIPGLHGSEL